MKIATLNKYVNFSAVSYIENVLLGENLNNKSYSYPDKKVKMHLFVCVMSISLHKQSHNPLPVPVLSQFLEWGKSFIARHTLLSNSFSMK